MGTIRTLGEPWHKPANAVFGGGRRSRQRCETIAMHAHLSGDFCRSGMVLDGNFEIRGGGFRRCSETVPSSRC